MIFLRSIELRPWPEREAGAFPFTLPVLASLRELPFSSPVTFFVGENGSGKSTVLEALACAVNSVTVGSESVRTDKTLSPPRKLAQCLKLTWERPTHRGFFLRAEDFFGYARTMRQT